MIQCFTVKFTLYFSMVIQVSKSNSEQNLGAYKNDLRKAVFDYRRKKVLIQIILKL